MAICVFLDRFLPLPFISPHEGPCYRPGWTKTFLCECDRIVGAPFAPSLLWESNGSNPKNKLRVCDAISFSVWPYTLSCDLQHVDQNPAKSHRMLYEMSSFRMVVSFSFGYLK